MSIDDRLDCIDTQLQTIVDQHKQMAAVLEAFNEALSAIADGVNALLEESEELPLTSLDGEKFGGERDERDVL